MWQNINKERFAALQEVEEVRELLMELDSIATQISFSSMVVRQQAYCLWAGQNGGLSEAHAAIAAFLGAINTDGVDGDDTWRSSTPAARANQG